MKTTVAVFFGGRSVEHEISVISALQAINAFDTSKYDIVPVYISKSGKWYTGDVLHVLRYWLQEYHVDGFVLMTRSTVCEELARLPMFRDVKLIGEWFPDSLAQKHVRKWHSRLAESHDGFMTDCRRMIRDDGGQS